jgi:hypothetical protein
MPDSTPLSEEVTPMTTTDVGLVARDKFSELPVAVSALLEDLPEDVTVHVVDCGYPEDLIAQAQARAARHGAALEIVGVPKFANTNVAWNALVAATSGDVLVCVESDVSVQPGCVAGLIAAVESGEFDVVTPTVCEGNLEHIHFDPPVSVFLDVEDGIVSELVRRPKVDHPRVAGTRRVAHVEKHTYAMSRVTARRLGKLDEQMHCRTDLDLSLTCRSRNLSIGIIPECRVVFRKAPSMPVDASLFAHRWDVPDAHRANERLVAKWGLRSYKSSVEFVHEMRTYLNEVPA